MSISDERWNLFLIQECNDAAALFTHGLRVVRDMLDDYTDAAAAMSLLALGAEKMLKLTVGLSVRNEGGLWPSVADMKKIGHRVQRADQAARARLSAHPGTAPGFLADLTRSVNADPFLPRILEALDRFGDSGRFYFLDYLSENPQPELAPQMLWVNMTTAIAQADPQLLAAISSLVTLEQGRADLNAVIVRSLTGWWDLYWRAWRTGTVGEEAKRFAPELRLYPRPMPWDEAIDD